MENQSEGSATSTVIPERHTVLWEHCISVGVRGSNELRKELGLNETSFRRVAPIAHAEPGRCYIYRVLDEVQKAAISMMNWRDSLSKSFDLDGIENDQEAQLKRLILQSITDDQQFKARKLTETLVDSILFSTTNEQKYFRDYFYFHNLSECGRSQQDRKEFFGLQNKNEAWHADWLCEHIGILEKEGLDVQKRWYLTNPGPVQKKWATEGVKLSSFLKRYKAVLPIALPNEMATLGRSYAHAYGSSRDVHFSPHDISSDFEADELLSGADKVGLLILALIIRCQHLMGCVPDGINKRHRDMHDGNAQPAVLLSDLKSNPAEVGDIVWVQGNLAEVLEITKSKYNYLAYRVKYIESPPLPEIPEDWFEGFEIKLITKRSLIEKAADELALENQGKPELQPTREQCLEYAKQAVAKLHHHQQEFLSRTQQERHQA